MTQIARLKDAEISNGNIINADDLDSEFNQLVSESNAQDIRVTNIESNNISLGGAKTFLAQSVFSNGLKTDTITPNTANGATSLTLAGAGVNAQTGTTYTVVTGDRYKLITFNNAAAVAVTLPQAGSTGFANSFEFEVKNIGAGTVTITPTTSTIDATTTVTVAQNQSFRVYGDNTNYFTAKGSVVPTSYYELLDTKTASASAFLEFTTAAHFASTYRKLVFELEDVAPATDVVNFTVLASTNGGSSYLGAASYSYVSRGCRHAPSAMADLGSASDSKIIISATDSMGNQANETYSGTMWLMNPSGAGRKSLGWQANYTTSTPNVAYVDGGGYILTTTAVNAIRFIMSSGNIASGTIKMYGVRA